MIAHDLSHLLLPDRDNIEAVLIFCDGLSQAFLFGLAANDFFLR